MKTVDKVAERIAGKGAVAVFEHDITFGRANKGLKVYSVKSWNGKNLEQKFVVKATTKAVEFELANALAQCDDSELSHYSILAPRFYLTEVVDDVPFIYQEFIHGIVMDKDWKSGLENLIAESAYKMSMGLNAFYHDKGITARKASMFCANLERRVTKHLGDKAANTMSVMASTVARELDTGTQIISHNDIYWSNFSVIDAMDGKKQLTFIDFGNVARNYLGADLHHFASTGFKNRKRARFFFNLANRISEISNTPICKIKAAAYFYAAHRNIMRMPRSADIVTTYNKTMNLLRRSMDELDCAA